jgi:outer membrane protein assembly factor BamB/tetratricopeptide (TPR) repeat protein
LALPVASIPIVIAPAAAAQDIPAADPPSPPPAATSSDGAPRDTAKDVYIGDSAELAERFELAGRLQRLGDYRQAGDVYREILSRLPDKLSPAAANDTALFVSASDVVRRAVLAWPAEAREAFATTDDTFAAPLLQPALAAAAADDYKPLRDLTELHPLSATGISAAAILQVHYLQSGDFLAAAWLGQDTLDAAMLAPADQPLWLFRTALAHTLAGQMSEADRLAALLAADHPAARGEFFGQDVELHTTLQELKAAGPALARYPAGSWMTLGGALSRSRTASVIPGMAKPGTSPQPSPAAASSANQAAPSTVSPSTMVRLLTLRFPAFTPRRTLGGMQAEREILLAQAAVEAGTGPSTFPVVDGGILYVSDGMRIMAADLDSGLPPPGWAATYPSDRAAVYPFSRQSISGGSARLATLTLTADSLLAVMGADANSRMGRVMGRQAAPSALVCLDRATGREQWRTAPTDFPESAGPVRNLQLAGTPLVYHNSIYILARGGEQAQFEDVYLICLSLTGQYRWSRYIVSANAFNPFTETMQQTAASELAVADGRVYISTNLGVAAAVDAFSGRIAWLRAYDRATRALDPRDRRAFFNGPSTGISRPFTMNPPLVAGGHLFVMPDDAPTLSIMATRDGSLLKRIAKSDLAPPAGQARRMLRDAINAQQQQPQQPSVRDPVADTLLAVNGNLIYAASTNGVVCMDWAAYQPEAFTTARPMIERWHKLLPSEIVGRGLLAGSTVIIPTQRQMFFLDAEGGRTLDTVPPTGSWEVNQPPAFSEGQGNVLVTADQIILASAQQLSVFADLNMARRRFLQQIEQSPQLAAPRLRYAESLLAASAYKEALEQLDQAIALLRPPQATGQPQPATLLDTPDRQRVFSVALAAAQRIIDARPSQPDTQTGAQSGAQSTASTNTLPAADQEAVTGLFTRAALAAASPQEHVELRRLQVVAAERRQDLAAMAESLQQILESPEWRGVRVIDEDLNLATTAGDTATRQLTTLISANPALYSPWDQKAAAMAAAARTGSQFAEIAERYPLSKSVLVYWARAAAAHEVAGDAVSAIACAHRALAALGTAGPSQVVEPGVPSGGALFELIARCELTLPSGVDAALFTAARAARLHPEHRISSVLTTTAGQALAADTFASLERELLRLADLAAEASRPDLAFPTYEQSKAAGQRNSAVIASQPVPLAEDVTAILTLPLPARTADSPAGRLAVFSPKRGLEIYDTTTRKALVSLPTAGVSLYRGVWVGDLFAAASDQVVFGVQASTGRQLWRIELSQIPQPIAIEPLREFRPGIFDDDQRGDPARIGRRNLAMLLRAQQEEMRAQAAGPESITDLRSAGDTIVITTSRGRVLLLAAATGRITAQAKVSNDAPNLTRTSSAFVATRALVDGMVTVSLISTATGRHEANWLFQNGQLAPVNIELAPNGLLAMLFADRLTAFNAHLPSNDFTLGGMADGANYADTTLPQHLLAAAGRWACTADSGSRLRVFAIAPDGHTLAATGTERTAIPMQAGQAAAQLAPQPAAQFAAQAALLSAGTRVLMLTRTAVIATSLLDGREQPTADAPPPTSAQPVDAWVKNISELAPAYLTALIAGKDHVVAVEIPPRQAMPRPSQKLHAINRQRLAPGGREVNIWQDTRPLPPLTTDARGVTGGIVTLQSDGKLLLFPGNAPNALRDK